MHGLHTPAQVNVALLPFSQAAHLKTGKISKATRMAEGVDSFQTKNDWAVIGQGGKNCDWGTIFSLPGALEGAGEGSALCSLFWKQNWGPSKGASWNLLQNKTGLFLTWLGRPLPKVVWFPYMKENGEMFRRTVTSADYKPGRAQ